jgi:ribosomal protein S17E
VSVIKPATLKTLIESKLEMYKSELKKDFIEFVAFLEKMAIIHDKHCHVVKHNKTGDFGMKNTRKSSDADSRSSGHNSGGSAYGGGSNMASDRDRTKPGHGRSSDATGTRKQSARELPPCLNTKK